MTRQPHMSKPSFSADMSSCPDPPALRREPATPQPWGSASERSAKALDFDSVRVPRQVVCDLSRPHVDITRAVVSYKDTGAAHVSSPFTICVLLWDVKQRIFNTYDIGWEITIEPFIDPDIDLRVTPLFDPSVPHRDASLVHF